MPLSQFLFLPGKPLSCPSFISFFHLDPEIWPFSGTTQPVLRARIPGSELQSQTLIIPPLCNLPSLEYLQVPSDVFRNSFSPSQVFWYPCWVLQCRLHGPPNSNITWIPVFLIPNSWLTSHIGHPGCHAVVSSCRLEVSEFYLLWMTSSRSSCRKSPTDFKNTRSEKAFLCLGSELFSIYCPHHPIIECSFSFPFYDKIELSMGERMLARKKHEGSLTAEKPSNPEATRDLAALFSDSPQSGTKLTRVQQRRSQPHTHTHTFPDPHLPVNSPPLGYNSHRRGHLVSQAAGNEKGGQTMAQRRR